MKFMLSLTSQCKIKAYSPTVTEFLLPKESQVWKYVPWIFSEYFLTAEIILCFCHFQYDIYCLHKLQCLLNVCGGTLNHRECSIIVFHQRVYGSLKKKNSHISDWWGCLQSCGSNSLEHVSIRIPVKTIAASEMFVFLFSWHCALTSS